MEIRHCFLLLLMWMTTCNLAKATPQHELAMPLDAPTHGASDRFPELLAKMQTADAISDPVRRCLEYPTPPGVEWGPESIQLRCDLLTPVPKFINEGAVIISTAKGVAIFDAGFDALLNEPHLPPPIKDGRIYRALDSFSSAAALPYVEQWLARSPKSALAHAAKGASLLAKASATRGTAYARDTSSNELNAAADLARAAAEELQIAYSLMPRLSAACALRTRALMLSGDSEQAITQGRSCTHAHPESYFAAAQWAHAAEPRWGGSETALAESAHFIEANRTSNALLDSIIGRIESDNAFDADAPLDEIGIHRLEKSASRGPNSSMLNRISAAWKDLGKEDLWMAYLSSAIAFDFDPGDTYRWFRASANIAARPEWAVIDYRILKEKYSGNPAIGEFLRQAEQNAHDGTGNAYVKNGTATYKGDQQRKGTLISECLQLGISDRKLSKAMETCSDSLITEWPDDPNVWFVRARVLQHRGIPQWKDAAHKYLALANGTDSEDKDRIEIIKNLLKGPDASR